MNDVQKLRKAVDNYKASLGKHLWEMTGDELEKYLKLWWAWHEADLVKTVQTARKK